LQTTGEEGLDKELSFCVQHKFNRTSSTLQNSTS